MQRYDPLKLKRKGHTCKQWNRSVVKEWKTREEVMKNVVGLNMQDLKWLCTVDGLVEMGNICTPKVYGHNQKSKQLLLERLFEEAHWNTQGIA